MNKEGSQLMGMYNKIIEDGVEFFLHCQNYIEDNPEFRDIRDIQTILDFQPH